VPGLDIGDLLGDEGTELTGALVVRLVKAAVLGALFVGALSGVVPGPPYWEFVLLGLFVGLVGPRTPWTIVAAAPASLAGSAFLAILGLVAPLTHVVALGLAFVGTIVSLLLRRVLTRRVMSLAILAVLVGVFLYQAVGMAGQAGSVIGSPQPETYSEDQVIFLRSFYLAETGLGPYAAFGQATAEDARFDTPPSAVAGWRSPVMIWLWSLLFDSGHGILYAFIALATGAMLAVYHLAARESEETDALIAPALMVAYFLAALPTLNYMQLEFWAVFAAIGSATLVYTKRDRPGVLVAVLAGAMREWLVSSVIAGAVHLLARGRRKRATPWVVSLVGLLLLYALNLLAVRSYLLGVGIEPALGAAGRLGNGGPGFILYTLQFSAGFYTNMYVIAYGAFILGLGGAIYLIRARNYYLPTLMLLPIVIFLFVGSGRLPGDLPGWNDYYSVSFMPFAFVLVPVAWRWLEDALPFGPGPEDDEEEPEAEGAGE
jgi:hypothetical protein